MIKLVAFDWNGTILSDTRACHEAVNEVLKFVNLKPVSLESYRQHFDVPVTRTYKGLGISEDDLRNNAVDLVNVFHTNYEKRASKIRTRAFAKELLRWLSRNKIKSIIFSNHVNEPIKKQLKRLKIEKYFFDVLANSEMSSSYNGRNKQEKLRDFVQNNNFLPDEVLIVGDSIEEIEIGKRLGAKTIALTQGFCSTKRLKKAGPDYLINSLEEIVEIIEKINYK